MERKVREPDAARAALDLSPDDPLAWHALGLALAWAGEYAEFLALCDRAAPRFGDAVIFAHNVVKDLAEQAAWDRVRDLAAALPPERREHAPALYYAGCAEVALGRHPAALELFERFKHAVLPRYAAFPLTDPGFNLIFRQGVLVERPEMVRQLAQQPVPAGPAIRFLGQPGGAGAYVVAHVLDARYFRRFAAQLCRGHRQAGLSEALHFHVLAADDAVGGEMQALARSFPDLTLGFSLEPPGPWDHPVYYTCARFLVMNRLLDHYGRTVMTLDADILPTLQTARIFAAADGADFACFQTGRDEPASVYQASIMVFDTGTRARAFVDDLVRFCVAKLALPPALAWMLDQAALYSVLTQRGVDDPGFRFASLDAILGVPLVAALRQLSDEAEKRAIMTRAVSPRAEWTDRPETDTFPG